MKLAKPSSTHASSVSRPKKPPQSPQTTSTSANVAGPAVLRPYASPKLLTFTEITGTVPNRMTKIIGLQPDGTLRKETAANLTKGVAKRIEVNGLKSLRDYLNSLTSANAISWGVNRLTECDHPI